MSMYKERAYSPRRRGRRRLATEEKLAEPLVVYVRPSEFREILEQADREEITISRWIRGAALRQLEANRLKNASPSIGNDNPNNPNPDEISSNGHEELPALTLPTVEE